jgi:predicted nucleic acid-binding Zn ribbon protein
MGGVFRHQAAQGKHAGIRRAGSSRRANGPAAWIQNLVDAVSRSDFEASLTHLASFPTRFSTSAQYRDAATWARRQLEAMG